MCHPLARPTGTPSIWTHDPTSTAKGPTYVSPCEEADVHREYRNAGRAVRPDAAGAVRWRQRGVGRGHAIHSAGMELRRRSGAARPAARYRYRGVEPPGGSRGADPHAPGAAE